MCSLLLIHLNILCASIDKYGKTSFILLFCVFKIIATGYEYLINKRYNSTYCLLCYNLIATTHLMLDISLCMNEYHTYKEPLL